MNCNLTIIDNNIHKICPFCKSDKMIQVYDEELSAQEEPGCYEEEED